MLENYSTKATVAKIRAINSTTLSKKNYSDLLNKQSVAEVANYLKNNTRYGDVLAYVDTKTIHRGHLETLIREEIFSIYVKLLKFQSLDKYNFFNYEIMFQEINLIIKCILKCYSKSYEKLIANVPSYFKTHSKINVKQLFKAKTFAEILKSVEKTSYYKMLSNILTNSDELEDFLLCERILYEHYYNTILSSLKLEFGNKIYDELSRIIKIRIDMENILNIYRQKNYFESVICEKFVIPIFGEISKEKFKMLINSKNKDDFLQEIKKTKYKNLISESSDLFFEKKADYIKFKNSKTALKNTSEAPVAFYSFFNLLEIEKANIIKIVEGIRYNLAPEIIENMLIM